MNINYHKPVLLDESVDYLITDPNGVYADITFGGGGHSREILNRLTNGKLIAFDQDTDAEKNAEAFRELPNFMFIRSNFAHVKNFLRLAEVPQIDGLLADLGVSSHQFDIPDRGFSFREDAMLDMRMNTQSDITASHILNTAEENELIKTFKLYGELHNAGRIVRTLVRERKKQSIKTTKQFNDILMPLAPKNREFKFLAKAYQALRIQVNNEMFVLEKLLESCADIIKKGGRIVFITYHSLEDRLVKNYIKTGKTNGDIDEDIFGNIQKPFSAVNKKVIVPQEREIETNNRARSAKLRIAERI